MKPQDAAERLITLVLRTTFDDVLDLTDPADADHEPHARVQAYAAVETAVRRQFKVRHDLGALEDAVERVVPKQHQAKFRELSDAFGAELGVVRQAGYVVGLAVGRALRVGVDRAEGTTPTSTGGER